MRWWHAWTGCAGLVAEPVSGGLGAVVGKRGRNAGFPELTCSYPVLQRLDVVFEAALSIQRACVVGHPHPVPGAAAAVLWLHCRREGKAG